MTGPDLQRLAELVKQRRLELNLGIKPAAASVGMSKDTWMRVENGLPVRHSTYDKIEDILQWATGSCRRVLDRQGDPQVAESGGAHGVEFAAVPPEVMEEEVRRAVTGAMVAGTDLTADRIREVNDRAIAYLRKRGILREPDGD